jgi:hypothetical protein
MEIDPTDTMQNELGDWVKLAKEIKGDDGNLNSIGSDMAMY